MRRVHAYCVGQAKSGTASLWAVFKQHFRAAHEPERAELLDRAMRRGRGEFSDDEMLRWVVERDRRLNLEIDVAWGNYFIVKELVEGLPDAKFIVLIRDPYTWIESVSGHLLSREIPSEVRDFMEFWFDAKNHPHESGESRLREAGLFSLAAHLTTWKNHLETCRRLIPPERLLIVRTHELCHSWPKIARFVGVDPELLDLEQEHINQRSWSGSLASLVDATTVEAAVANHCADVMRDSFPEVKSLADAYAIYKTGNGPTQPT